MKFFKVIILFLASYLIIRIPTYHICKLRLSAIANLVPIQCLNITEIISEQYFFTQYNYLNYFKAVYSSQTEYLRFDYITYFLKFQYVVLHIDIGQSKNGLRDRSKSARIKFQHKIQAKKVYLSINSITQEM